MEKQRRRKRGVILWQSAIPGHLIKLICCTESCPVMVYVRYALTSYKNQATIASKGRASERRAKKKKEGERDFQKWKDKSINSIETHKSIFQMLKAKARRSLNWRNKRGVAPLVPFTGNEDSYTYSHILMVS